MKTFRYIITEEDIDTPIRNIVKREFHFSSRLMTKVKKNQATYLNGISYPGWVKGAIGDELTVVLPDEKSDFEPDPTIPVYPVYEDDDVLVVNKQPGIIVHPTRGHPTHTMANGIQHYMEETGQVFKVRFANRLDMDTSGLLVVAKRSHTQDSFMKQMKANTVRKRYVAIVKGIVAEDHGTIDVPIGRPDPEHVERGVMLEGGYPSVTHYTVLERYKKHSLVELLLETGRTHQIRVHMAHIGYPVLGDILYGGEDPFLASRQMLHSRYLEFNHPVTDERICLEGPLFEDMERLIEKLRK